MKNSRRYLLLATTIVALVAAGPGWAQNPGNGGTTYSGLEGATRPEEFLGKFIDLTRAEVAANTALSKALGISDAALPAESALQPLDMNASIADLTHATAASGVTHQRVTQTLGTHVEMSDANKANFANGALALTQTAREFTALTRNIGATKQALKMAGAPARVALYAARTAPDVTAELRAELKAVVAFANANKVTLSPEVIEVAAAM